MQSSPQIAENTKKSYFGLLHNQFTIFFIVISLSIAIGFGLWRMLTAERSYRDLVVELQSKTFGNKWIAAFELSKVLANKKIPAEEIPWLLSNLTSVYRETSDVRTREFVIVALSSLQSLEASDLFFEAIASDQGNVRLHAIMAFASLPKLENSQLPWEKLRPLLANDDSTLVQLTLLVIAHHACLELKPDVTNLLVHPSVRVRHAAVVALAALKDESVFEQLKEILLMSSADSKDFEPAYVAQLKMNALKAIGQSNIKGFRLLIEDALKQEADLLVVNEMRILLNNLKN
jgi:HEAT repeat protein